MMSRAHPGVFGSTVSHTTRAPRPGEVEGVTYHYISPAAFARLVAQDAFAEHASFSGHSYGTSRQTIADQAARGLVAVLDIEMEGVKQMRAGHAVDARYVFVKPPSFGALEARLRGRGTESEEQIGKRLARARAELAYADTPGVHDLVVVNDDVDEAFRALEGFIFGRAS